MSRLTEVFDRARSQGRAALIGYLPAGFPTAEDSARLMTAMVAGGVDIVEVGMPYSDPVMDGPVIQAAANTALAGGATMHTVMSCVSAVRDAGAVACVMSYWNPIERYGVAKFADDLAAAGGSAAITPDLSPQEAAEWVGVSDNAGVERVFLVAPSSTQARLDLVCSTTNGFVYAASLMGVTGNAEADAGVAQVLVTRTREHTSSPVAVGLGVSTAEQAHDIAKFADGVIVGSAFIRAVNSASSIAEACERVETLARQLREGVCH